MRILSRYVLREFLVPLFYCLVTFCMIFVIFDLFDNFSRLMQSEPPWTFVLRYYLCFIGPTLVWLVPAAMLLASLYTMWQFSHRGELTAMRASGVGFGKITAPLLSVAVVLSAMLFLMGEFVVPDAALWAQRVAQNRFKPLPPDEREEVPYYNSAERRYWRIERMNLDRPSLLEGVRVTQEREDRTREVEIESNLAEYLDGQWWFYRPVTRRFDENDSPIPAEKDALSSLTLRAMPQFKEQPRDFVNEVKEWEFFPLDEMIHYLNSHPTLPRRARLEKTYDLHFRIASPWSVIVITLFAIPAGVASGRQSVLRGVLMAVGMFLAFFALTHACLYAGQSGMIPAWFGAWLPNFVFLVAGIMLYKRQR